MEIKVVSIKKNPLLSRKEVDFLVETKSKTKTPSRVDIKKSIADKMKLSEEIVSYRCLFFTRWSCHLPNAIYLGRWGGFYYCASS